MSDAELRTLTTHHRLIRPPDMRVRADRRNTVRFGTLLLCHPVTDLRPAECLALGVERKSRDLVDQSNDWLPNRDPDHCSDLEIDFKRSKLVANS